MFYDAAIKRYVDNIRLFVHINNELCFIFSLMICTFDKSSQIHNNQLSKIRTMKCCNYKLSKFANLCSTTN